MLKNIKISFVIILFINTFAFNYKRGYYMLGVLVWLVVILLICFSVLGWYWAIIEVILLPLFALFLIIYVDFPENRFDTKRFKSDIKYLLNKLYKK